MSFELEYVAPQRDVVGLQLAYENIADGSVYQTRQCVVTIVNPSPPPATAPGPGCGPWSGNVGTRFGWGVVYRGAVAGNSSILETTQEAQGALTAGFSTSWGAPGVTNNPDVQPNLYASSPTLVGIPGNGKILWVVTVLPVTLHPSITYLFSEYAISVSTGTPASAPSSATVMNDLNPQVLSTGLTNGTTYRARVQAFLAVGPGRETSSPACVSNIAECKPRATAQFVGGIYQAKPLIMP